jgi:3-oxoacyl-[acyl-carrier-protein] synthase II
MPAERERAASSPVVVTGIGSVSALGVHDGAGLAAALERSTPALAPIRAFPTGDCRSRLGGEVEDLGGHLLDGEARRLSRASQLAVVAARLALADAGSQPGQLPTAGLVLGSHWGDFRSSEAFARGFLERGPLGLSPLIFPNTVMNAMAAQVSIALGLRGPVLTLNEMDVAGELAVARAHALLLAGRARAVLAGGSDEMSPVLYRELGRLGLMSPTDPGPEACRPFDRRASGTVLGEGATFLVLEAADVARARGARVYAELAGAAWGNLPSQARGFPSPGRSKPLVIRRALAAAHVAPDAIEGALLTGSGRPAQDASELDLVARALPPGRARVSALTPLAGEHAGLGALRTAAAALVATGSALPVLPELSQPIRSDLRFVTAPGERVLPNAMLVHGLARGGAHVTLVLRAWSPPHGCGARVETAA